MSKKEEHLSVWGTGPLYVGVIVSLTVIFAILNYFNIMPNITFDFLKYPLIILGILMIVFGVFIWAKGVFGSKLFNNVKSNSLITTGVYSYTRNPVYAGYIFVCTGVLLVTNNLLLLILPILFWVFLTILMKKTEEKWLLKLYGEEYQEYCKKVNRCIPCRSRQC